MRGKSEKNTRQRSRQANSGAPNGQYPRPHSSDQGMAAEERKGALSESVQGPRGTKRRRKNSKDTSTGGDHKRMELQARPWRLAPEEVVKLESQLGGRISCTAATNDGRQGSLA
jgi:hypothetical protein